MKHKRLFIFGCSHTNYHWPTWADIFAYNSDFEVYQNWALSGLGNSGIFYQLMEAHSKNQFGSDDLVILMWTFLAREDRYYKDKWQHGGSIWQNSFYDADFIKKYYCERGATITELAHIQAAKIALDSWNCSYRILSSNNIFGGLDSYDKSQYWRENSKFFNALINNEDVSDYDIENIDVIKNYYEVFKDLEHPAFLEYVEKKWPIKPYTLKYKDNHLPPKVHLAYLPQIFKDIKIKEKTIQWVEFWHQDAISRPNKTETTWQQNLPNRF